MDEDNINLQRPSGNIGWSTSSNPSLAGMARLEFFDNQGSLFSMVFNQEQWAELNDDMLDSLKKYEN